MPIIMALWVLLGFGSNTPLTPEEMVTKECHQYGQDIENRLIESGMGETWKHSQPQTPCADREIES